MNCSEFKDLIIVGVFGELTGPQKEAFDSHARSCPDCGRLCRETKQYYRLFEKDNDIPFPDWQRSWDVIANRTFRKTRRPFFYITRWRYAVVSAAVLAVFALGLLAGRQFFFPATGESPVASNGDYRYTASIEHYVENLEPLLIDFANRSDEQREKEYSALEKQVINEMLLQTRLLKRIASRRNEATLTRLLEDLEFILVDMSNLGPGDSEAVDQLIRFLEEKGLKHQLRLLADEKPFI